MALFLIPLLAKKKNKSTTTIKQLNEVATEAITKNIQSCVVSATQDQLVKIQNTGGDVKIRSLNQKQGSTVDSKCLFSTKTQNDIQDQVAEKIDSVVKAKGGLFASNSKQNIDIKNLFKTSINNETVASQVSGTMQKQTVQIVDTDGSVIIGNMNQEQTAQVIAEAIINSGQYSEVLNGIATKIDAKAEAESSGIFGSLFGGIFIAVILVGLGVAIYKGGPPLLKWIREKQAAGKMTPTGLALPRRPTISMPMPSRPPAIPAPPL
jgi:hypothetical protein